MLKDIVQTNKKILTEIMDYIEEAFIEHLYDGAFEKNLLPIICQFLGYQDVITPKTTFVRIFYEHVSKTHSGLPHQLIS